MRGGRIRKIRRIGPAGYKSSFAAGREIPEEQQGVRACSAVVRKHLGHEPIPAVHAAEFQCFYTAHFNPYLNFHRPCGFATVELMDNGKRRAETAGQLPLPLVNPRLTT